MEYIVEYFEVEEHKREWVVVPLEMCRYGRLCKKCKKDIKHLDVCDNIFYDTDSKQVAEDKLKELLEDGFQARIKSK